MIINDTSKISDLLQSCQGTWEVATDNGWKCIQLGKVRIFKKLLSQGSNVLPKKFLEKRYEVCPIILFTKDSINGQVLDLTQNAVDVDENCIGMIIQF